MTEATPRPSPATTTTGAQQVARTGAEVDGDQKEAAALAAFLADWSRMKTRVYKRYVRTLTLLQLSISAGVVLVVGLRLSNMITFGALVAALPLGLVSGRLLDLLCEKFSKRPLRQCQTRFPDAYLSELDERGDTWVSSVLLFGLGSFILVEWAATSLPPLAQVLVFFLFALVTIVLSAVLWNDRLQEVVKKRDIFRGGPAAPLVYDLIVVLVAIALYGGATFALARHEPAAMNLAAPVGGLSVEKVEIFYAWQIADSVPALKITQTLGLPAPLTYRSWKFGALVLLFKLSIIVPIVGSVRVFWRQHQQRASDAQTPS